MRECDEMFKNILMPGVTVKSRAYFNGMESTNDLDNPVIQLNQPRNIPLNKDAQMISQSQKGFYTWLSSPKAIQSNRKANNVAVITPTQHHT